jgi:hypothetical protein
MTDQTITAIHDIDDGRCPICGTQIRKCQTFGPGPIARIRLKSLCNYARITEIETDETHEDGSQVMEFHYVVQTVVTPSEWQCAKGHTLTDIHAHLYDMKTGSSEEPFQTTF